MCTLPHLHPPPKVYGKATLAPTLAYISLPQHAHLIAPFARRAHINEMRARSIGIKWWIDIGPGRSVEGDLVHDELKRMFEPCGPVEEIIANMGPGIAYLRFESKDAMPKALEMHQTTYKGGSRNREGTLKVYAGGIVPDRSPPSSRPPSCAPPSALLNPRGGTGGPLLAPSTLAPMNQRPRRVSGSSELIAPFARRSGKGSGPPQHELNRIDEMKSRSIGIKWRVDHGNGRTTEGEWDENEIKTMFSPCGSVEEVMLMGPGTAYLRFDNKDAMPQALEMHNTTYTGGRRNRPGTFKVYKGGEVPDRSPSSARPGGKGGGKGGGGGKGEIDERKARSIGIKWWIDIGPGRSVEGDLVHDELKRMFEPCGPVEEIIANMGPGIAYLRFESKDAMPKALEMHQTTYKGGSRNREGTLKVYAGGRVPDRSPSSARPTWRAPPFSLPRGGMPHIWKTHPWRPLHLHL